MKIKNTIKSSFLGLVLGLMVTGLTFSTVGCTSQQTISELIGTVGTAVASLETIEGANPDLVKQIETDTQTAETIVANWKTGTPTTEVIQALQIVENDLNLFPVSPTDAALIDLAIGTVDQILALLPSSNVAGTTTLTASNGTVLHLRHVPLTVKIHNSKEFKKEWNKLANNSAHLPVGAVLK